MFYFIKEMHIMSLSISAAQFIVFREKRRMATREIFREKSLTKKRRKKIGQICPEWRQFDEKTLYFFWGEIAHFGFQSNRVENP